MIRQGTLADAETIVAQRRAMFHEMGYRDEQVLDAMCEAFRPWLEGKMRDNQYLAWFAVDADGAIAAGLGLWLMDWPPHMIGPGAPRGNILNVYTRPESRRDGIGKDTDGNGARMVPRERGQRGDTACQRRWPAPLRIDGIPIHQRDADTAGA